MESEYERQKALIHFFFRIDLDAKKETKLERYIRLKFWLDYALKQTGQAIVK